MVRGLSSLRPAQPGFEKLKPGPGLTPDAVFEDQGRRLREAMFELVADRGYGQVSLRGLSKLAGISTHTFYRHYPTLDEFFASICESTMLEALRRMASVSTASRDREERLRAGVRSLMRDLAAQPDAARLALVDALAASPYVRTRMKGATRTFEQLLADLLRGSHGRGTVSRHLVIGMVAGTMRVARTTTMAGRAEELPGLADELTRWLLSLPHEEVLALQGRLRSGASPRRRRETYPFPDHRLGCDLLSEGGERERILRAVARLAAANGLAGLTIRRIRAEAGVSRRSFDAHFSGVDDAYLESIEWMVTLAAARAEQWAEGAASEEQRTHRLVLALCAQAARNSALASVAFGGILEAGREGLLRRERLVSLAAVRLGGTRSVVGLAMEASVAAVWDIACAEVAAGRVVHLPQVAPLLSYVVLAPVRGPQRAAEATALR